MSNYSLSSASPRWWWPSAAVGTAAAAVVGILLVAPNSTAMPARPALDVGPTTTVVRPICPPPPDARYVGMPWVAPERTGCDTVDRWWLYVSYRR